MLDGDASATDRPTDQPIVALVEALEEITYLREQAALWQEEARRKDHLLAAALEAAALKRTPALEESSEPREERVMGSEEEPYSTHAPPMPDTPVSEAQHKRKVPWWRAFFGLE